MDIFPAFCRRLCRRKRRKKEVNSMTMVKRDSNSIWSLVREDRDIDDLIFAGETLNGREMSQPCSDR